MGGQGVLTPPGKLQSYIGFLSNTGQDPLENHKATKPAFNVGPIISPQAFRWWANDGLLLVVLGSSLPSSTKKTNKKMMSGLSW